MAVNPNDALSAYRAALSRVEQQMQAGQDGPGAAPAQAAGPDSPFMQLVQSSIANGIDANRGAERVAMDAVGGQADLSDVVTAVANAEASLQTVVAVRDRIIQAYQEIMRMPI